MEKKEGFVKYFWHITYAHTIAYFIAGIFAVVVINYRDLYATEVISSFMHSVLDVDIIDNYKEAQKALLVIDMQIDYIDKNGKFPINHNQIDNLIVTTNNIIEEFNQNEFIIIYVKNIFRKNNIKNIFRNYAV